VPGRDGTGPMGYGAMTGRGMGNCAGVPGLRYGAGLGFRRGFGRGFGGFVNPNLAPPVTDKEYLQEQRELLKSRLEYLDKQLENI
jgi:hypothetical protein